MLKRFQQGVWEMIARGFPLAETADRICRLAEAETPGSLCSVLTVDRSGLLHPLAAPSLPMSYSAALDGIPVGPKCGSCGTAAFRREPVTAIDIFSDPLWTDYRELAEPLGVKACWSSPIANVQGRVLGTFAFYFFENRGPTVREKDVVAACVDLLSMLLEREDVRSENQRLAYFDVLTDLRNRASFNADLARLDEHQSVALLLIDVDHLKRVNDSFGHGAGDDLIREVARRVAEAAGAYKTFRIGGDEFAVLITGPDAGAGLPETAARISSVMRRHARCNDHVIAPTVTCGGAICRDPSEPSAAAALQQNADLALYHAKETARGGFVVYGDDLATTIARRFRSLQIVSSALAEDRVEAHYQPIVRLDTRDIVGLEALCRIRTSDGGILAAAQFSEAMQDLWIGSLVTDRMLAQVARDIRSWLDLQIPVQHVGVNVTMADFQNGDLHERILAAFSVHGVPLKHVILEVTESVYMEDCDRKVASAIERLRTEGLRVALDDFGTGYASLTHLLTFPVDIIKVDKTFVERITSGDGGRIIIKALLDMARGLDMRVVAEGVETGQQAHQLERLGCSLAQGYLFGRPVDLAKTTNALLRFAQRQDLSSETSKAPAKTYAA